MSLRVLRFGCLFVAALVAAIAARGDLRTGASGPDRPYRAVMVEVASDSGAPANVPANVSPAELARRLVQAPDLVSAVVATQEALARGGVSTIRAGGVPSMAAVSPAAAMTVTLPETSRLALEARHRDTESMLTAGDLGHMLRDFGWHLAGGSDSGQAMVAFFQGWVREAQKAPAEPLNFTPLFLQAMASYQVPPVDLSAGVASPDALRLTALEVELVGAAFDRGLTARGSRGAMAQALDSDIKPPCSFVKDTTGKVGERAGQEPQGLDKQVNDVVTTEAFGVALGAGLQQAGMTKENAEVTGDALAAVGTVMRLWKLVEFYRSGNVQVIVSERRMHKPVEIDNIDVMFDAVAGVSDADWEAYQQKWGGDAGMEFNARAKECLDSLGLPRPPDLGDLAKDAENWSVEWKIVEGSPEHAEPSPDNDWNGPDGRPLPAASRFEKPLTRSGAYSASTSFKVRLKPETRAAHEGGGPLTTSPVTVRASLKSGAMPSLGTFVNGAKGGLGLADALVELAAGWFQTMVTPKSYATIAVEYESPPGRYLLDFETTLVADVGLKPMKIHVRARDVPVQLGNTAAFPVSQPLELLSFTGEAGDNCSYSSDVHLTRPFTVHGGKLITTERDGKTQVEDFEVDISTGDLAGSFTWRCPAPDGGVQEFTFPVPDGELSGIFTVNHVSEAVANDEANRSILRIRNWQVANAGSSATKTYSSGPPIVESTTLTLRLAP